MISKQYTIRLNKQTLNDFMMFANEKKLSQETIIENMIKGYVKAKRYERLRKRSFDMEE